MGSKPKPLDDRPQILVAGHRRPSVSMWRGLNIRRSQVAELLLKVRFSLRKSSIEMNLYIYYYIYIII